MSSALFRKVMGHFPTGVTVVTTRDSEGAPYGVTVSSLTSVSLDPLLISICLGNEISGLGKILAANCFAVNVLAEDQEELSVYFSLSGNDRSKGDFITGSHGLPILLNSLGSLECEVAATFPGGDHTILLGRVIACHSAPSGESRKPLLYFRGHYARIAADD